MTDASSLDPVDLLRASISASELRVVDTMCLIRADYVETSVDEKVRKSFDTLLRTVISRRSDNGTDKDKSRMEARAIVLVGEAGAGKSATLERLFRTHPAIKGYGQRGSGCPLISITVPAPCTLKSLGMTTLHGLGYPLVRDLREHLLWARVHEALRTAGILLLHFDELHNLTDSANVVEIDTIRKAMKSLMVSNDWPIGLILSGLPSLVPSLRGIDEVRRRGRFIQLPDLSVPSDTPLLCETVDRGCSTATIAVANGFAEQIAPRLAHAALHRYGIAVELIHEAIEDCLMAGCDELSTEHFANAFSARTGCADRMNVFVAPDWPDIDATLVLQERMPLSPEDNEGPRPKPARSKTKKAKK